MDIPQQKGIFYAVLAAVLYSVSTPFSKLLLNSIPSTLLAGILYLGAGIGMLFILIFRKCKKTARREDHLTKADFPYTLAMILLDIAAPVLLMFGLTMTSANSAALLNNFEIAATALIALFMFRESISPRLWLGILFVTVSCVLLSFEDPSSLHFSAGSLFVLSAAVCWGLENNCTRTLSSKDPLEIVLLKGIFSGGGALLIGLYLGERTYSPKAVLGALVIGLIAYGLSIFFYVYAQRFIGAARTSAYYAIAPFVGSVISLLIFRETPAKWFGIALLIMAVGSWFSSRDTF